MKKTTIFLLTFLLNCQHVTPFTFLFREKVVRQIRRLTQLRSCIYNTINVKNMHPRPKPTFSASIHWL